jgi:hypothetical protein
MSRRETVINKALGADLVVTRRGNRVRVILNTVEPVKIDPPSASGFQFLPGRMLSPQDSAPYIAKLDEGLLEEIRTALDGVEWSAGTCDAIAQAMIAAGYQVREPDDK